jgi:hypothetical protein
VRPDFASSRDCGMDCPDFVGRWRAWYEDQVPPFGILECGPIDGKTYMERIDSKARNMRRKADRLYTYARFLRDHRLGALERVNRSKPIRQGKPMTAAYLEALHPERPQFLCLRHRDLWIAAWRGTEMVAYVQLVVLGRYGIVNKSLGHADAPAVMNGMYAYLAESMYADVIHYLSVSGSNPGLAAFKESVGFRDVTP